MCRAHRPPIHAHVERRILHVGEAARRRIDLWRGDTEVKENAVDCRNALRREDRRQIAKIIVHERHPARSGCEPHLRRRDRRFVLIDTDEAPCGRELCRNAPRMSRTAERAVHIGAFRHDGERRDRLGGENAHMMKLHDAVPLNRNAVARELL